MKTILVSGISGFIGANLESYLSDKFLIKGITRKKSSLGNNISLESVSVSDFNKSDVFIHLAGKAHDLKMTTEEEEYFEINTKLTKKVFNLFLESECTIFIFMSTVKATADSIDGVLNEDYKPNPKTAYGKSKRAAEEYLLSHKIPEGKKAYILRPCMVHGPNNKGNLNLLFAIINNGIPFPLGKFKNRRSFLSIDNLCYIIKELIRQEPESGSFVLADDEDLSTIDLVKLIGKITGKPAKIINMPKWLIKGIAKLGNVIPLPLNTDRLQKLTENYCVSNKKIKEVLNINLPLTSIDGFKKTLKSFKIDS